MRIYVDSSALIKRAFLEAESDALEVTLRGHVEQNDALLSSSLSWIEVSRALKRGVTREHQETVAAAVDDSLSGVAERPITPDVVSLARRIGPARLRSLDAIHLATAVLLDADALITYDDRLAAAARHADLTVISPSGSA